MFIIIEHTSFRYWENPVVRTADIEAILEKAVTAVGKATGLRVEVIGGQRIGRRVRDRRQPAEDKRLRIIRGKNRWEFDVVVKPWLNVAMAGLLAHEFNDRRNRVIVTRHANKPIAERMREQGIYFVDACGNAYLEAEDLLVWVQGQKPADRETRQLVGQPFKPAGMQVIFALICLPGLEQKTYREIARVAGVALGTVDATIRNLKLIGHLLEGKKIGRRIVRREELFDKWVGMYPQQLKPKQFLGRFAARDPEWWRAADLAGTGALWGGEPAVQIETRYLKPEIATLYLQGEPNRLIVQYKLKQDDRGNVELYKRFWQFHTDQEALAVVPTPLTYADLMATGEGRNLEAAKDLREKKLGRYFK
ncbi:MAG TPA: type IV toxin-antitoxin system AbiEi family antitoxin [Bacteroidota bacterium]